MTRGRISRAPLVATVVLLTLAPLAGGLLHGLPDGFTRFPPLLHKNPDHVAFHLGVFTVFAVLALLAAAILIWPARFGFNPEPGVVPPETGLHERRRFPVWGWVGLLVNVVGWAAAWGPFEGLGSWGEHTFFPIWLGYILVMDGLVYRRAGSSMLSRSKGKFLALFPASAASWWYFEFLNRFVQNWWYEGSFDFSAWRYVAHATICFSTVLPAVFETGEWLGSHRWFQTAYGRGPILRTKSSGVSYGLLAGGTLGLVLVAAMPVHLFFLTWLAPLAVLVGGLHWAGIRTPFDDLCRGDFRALVVLAIAALVCGVFWEMWNFWSMPKWRYNVPFVSVLHVFEMPVVGFAGYLPFGPICWCFWLLVRGFFITGCPPEPGPGTHHGNLEV